MTPISFWLGQIPLLSSLSFILLVRAVLITKRLEYTGKRPRKMRYKGGRVRSQCKRYRQLEDFTRSSSKNFYNSTRTRQELSYKHLEYTASSQSSREDPPDIPRQYFGQIPTRSYQKDLCKIMQRLLDVFTCIPQDCLTRTSTRS